MEKDKNCIVDFRMRTKEKEYIKSLGYNVIENGFNENVYDEISSHVDIYYIKLDDVLVIAPEKEKTVKENSKLEQGVGYKVGEKTVACKYPEDVSYNVCIMGKKAIHNFNFTDPVLKTELINRGYELVNVEQGYSKCSICVIDDNSCITSDIGIARTLMDNGIDVLFVSELDIKLKKRVSRLFNDESKMSFEYSDMNGFIGGAMVRINDKIILFGDIDKLINGVKIKEFVESKGLELVCFEGLDVIDYGGIVTF